MSKDNDIYTKETDTRFTLRINTQLLDKLKTQATKNKRSTAKEIEFILEQYYEDNQKE